MRIPHAFLHKDAKCAIRKVKYGNIAMTKAISDISTLAFATDIERAVVSAVLWKSVYQKETFIMS